MGCHTWFSVPFLTDKKEIIKLAQKYINSEKYLSSSAKKMFQYAIDNELVDPCCQLACISPNKPGISQKDNNSWSLYLDIQDFSLLKYNEKNNTNIKRYSDEFHKLKLETYSDEPRIGGYPDIIIKSYEEMCSFISTGYDGINYDENDKEIPFHYDFYFSGEIDWKNGEKSNLGVNQEYRDKILNDIKQFFINHPKGIITFG